MPLSELPAYLESVRERGQGDDIPVVDMGMIVDDQPPVWKRALVYSSAACVLLAIGVAGYAFTATEKVVIDAGDIGPSAVAQIVSAEGGRVFSVKKMEDGTCEVRVFTLKRMSSFLDELRGKKEFKRVELKDD